MRGHVRKENRSVGVSRAIGYDHDLQLARVTQRNRRGSYEVHFPRRRNEREGCDKKCAQRDVAITTSPILSLHMFRSSLHASTIATVIVEFSPVLGDTQSPRNT